MDLLKNPRVNSQNFVVSKGLLENNTNFGSLLDMEFINVGFSFSGDCMRYFTLNVNPSLYGVF